MRDGNVINLEDRRPRLTTALPCACPGCGLIATEDSAWCYGHLEVWRRAERIRENDRRLRAFTRRWLLLLGFVIGFFGERFWRWLLMGLGS